jgi:ABC-type transport system involved in multi-copper enzyme maturation permease subunit
MNQHLTGTIITKELRAIVLSPKFAGSFFIACVLILLSVYTGIQDYKRDVANYDESRKLVDQEMQALTNWGNFSTRVSRVPDPMEIFVAGVNNDVGRRSTISGSSEVKLRGSTYTEETLFALFRYFDLSFIVQVALSLLALLFTYDAVNGERETGTIQLAFSNPVPRAQFILGKFIGAFLGLILPLLVPILLGVLLVMVTGIPFRPSDWARLSGFIGVSVLYVSFFIALGVLTSVLVKSSNTSFLVALVAWILLVFIVPRAASMAAGQIVPVPSAAELDSKRDAFEKDAWNQQMSAMRTTMRARDAAMDHMSDADRAAYRDAHEWQWMQEDDSLRKDVDKSIDRNSAMLDEDAHNRQAQQERLTYLISGVSPSALFQLASMNLAQTDVGVKARYDEAMGAYRTAIKDFSEKKAKETDNSGGIRITIDSNTGFKISAPKEGSGLNLAGLPLFTPPSRPLAGIFQSVAIETGALLLFIALCFGITYFRFLKYEIAG